MRRWIILAAVCIAGMGWYYRTHPLTAKVEIRGKIFTVDVAATEEAKQRGLGGRASLEEDRGMLFPYDHKEQFNFWMKDMRFPIDVVWIVDRTVSGVTENVPPPAPGQRPMMMKPDEPVDTVLELKAGTVRRYGIRRGDAVKYLDR